jgi:hypothetical protein
MTVPIACRLDALSAEERERQQTLRAKLEEATKETRETADGYTFVFRGGAEIFRSAAEWTTLERRCCPFLDFELEWRAADDNPSLTVSGNAEAKLFIASTFVK